MRGLSRATRQQDRCDHQGQKSPEIGQDLSNVVAAAAKHGEEGIADCDFELGCTQAAFDFNVRDLGFDGAAAAEIGDKFWC